MNAPPNANGGAGSVWRLAEFPALATLLLAGFSWFFTRTIDRITAPPTVEYAISTIPAAVADSDSVAITIRNISTERLFRDVRVLVYTDSLVRFSEAPLLPFPADIDNPLEIETLGRSASLSVPVLHPGWAFILTAVAPRSTRFNVRVRSDSDALYFVQSSFLTTLVRNESRVLMGATAIWGLLIIAYMIGLQRVGVVLAQKTMSAVRRRSRKRKPHHAADESNPPG